MSKAILPLVAAAALAAAEPATLTVHVDRDGATISPTLFGIFFEEINRGGDGGLYAEMVENRSFEDDAHHPVSWSGLGRERLVLDRDRPINPRNPTALRIDLGPTGGGVANVGFRGAGAGGAGVPWETKPQPMTAGLAIRKGAVYRLSLHVRGGNGFGGALTARLEGRTGAILATAAINGIDTDWKKQELELVATEGDQTARLVLEATGGGSVWIDMVSLFPQETWKGHGLRMDLAEMVAGMKPRFVRFPGGCFVEGDRLANAVRWKDTIGPVEERVGNWCIWGYRTTGGFGAHEFLQWCEDLGAEPLYVINCGMAHADHVPMERMQEWVQDALDLIEYARGPVDSKWGAMRAKAGHPAPFRLNHLQIGNENGGPIYHERYALFHDAIKAKHPDIKLVACVWGGVPTNRPLDIIDEHYYNTPRFFRERADMYDSYDRGGSKVYVGEYAVTQQCGLGNADAALGEAAYMTGLERNADHVVMASYAPLFVNPTWRRWNPNAIVFDQGRCYGTPSYHVQALFANHVGDVVCPSELALPPSAGDMPAGGISLGTWLTQAEYRDVRVERAGTVLFDSSRDRGLKPWRRHGGDWSEVDGALRQTSDKENLLIATGDAGWGPEYTLTLKARKLGGKEGFIIGFQLADDREHHWLNLGGWGNAQHGLEGIGEVKKVDGRIEDNRWYDIRIELKGQEVVCSLDGREILRQAQKPARSLFAVASRTKDGRELILKVVNTGAQAMETAIAITGAKSLQPSGKGWSILAGHPADENTFERPRNVAAAAIPVTGVAPRFVRSFPARSVTVLRLGMER